MIILKKQRAFSLSELLTVLAVIGLICAFAIPSVITSMRTHYFKAVWRETLRVASQLVHRAAALGYTNESIAYFLMDNLNAKKLCPNGAQVDGCYSQVRK